jgi:8-oxo-dGTP diphosphatase
MIEVAAAVLIQNGKVLIARRRPGVSQGGLWEFPGGKIKAGETPEQCLTREIREELGLAVAVADFLGESVYTYPRETIRLLAYRVRATGGSPAARDHAEIAWVGIDALDRYLFSPADLPFVDLLKQRFRRLSL